MKPISSLIALFILATFLPSSTLAQSFTDPWSEPVNLSHSGAATNPVMVQDSNGVVHVFWWDEFDGNMYSRLDEEGWSPPLLVSAPFGEYTPTLVADSQGYLHAFWTDEDQVLYYANVSADGISASAWNLWGFLAGSAMDFDVQIDAQDYLHVAYLRSVDTPEAPAGLYYRRSTSRGDEWLNSVLIYQSLYLRKLTPDDAHVDTEITYSGDEQHVYLAWDNPLRGQTFLAKSLDGGDKWDEPLEIDEPEQSSGEAGPSHLSVYAQGNNVLLIWRTGNPEMGCTEFYQWSLDGGDLWQPRQRLPGSLFGCPEQAAILRGEGGPIRMLVVSNQAYLQAWDGARWSDSQLESALSSFVDPESGQSVNLGCREAALIDEQRLVIVGCGAGESGDIWWLERTLGDVAEWYPHESLWQALTTITREDAHFSSLVLVADSDGRIHALWSQSSNPTSNRTDSSIYYTRWEDQRLWLQPVAVLKSPEQSADQPAIALGPAESLFATWRRGERGEICFSQAIANLAALSNAWTEPVCVSDPERPASGPDILVNDRGEIFIAYAVPVNEGRGVYLTSSSDNGRTWSDPVRAFDGAAAGWVMLDRPQLALTGEGELHLLWSRYSPVSGDLEPVALAYARSLDGGMTWSDAETVAETPVLWSQILGVGESTVHRLWRESSGGTTTLWHELSENSGVAWNRVAQLSVFGKAVGNPSLTWDRAGNMHLLQVVDRGTGSNVLQHWIWDGQRWGSSDSLNLDLDLETNIGHLAAVASPLGDLAVIFSTRSDNPDSGPQEELLFTARSIEQSGGLATPLPVASVTPVVLPTPTPGQTVTPTLTSTPDLSTLGVTGGGGNVGSSWDGLMIGAVLAGMIVALVFGIGVWKAKGG
jgi:hypothetical protein